MQLILLFGLDEAIDLLVMASSHLWCDHMFWREDVTDKTLLVAKTKHFVCLAITQIQLCMCNFE